jgi:hypothetical protein
MTLTSSTRTFKVDSTDVADAGDYTVNITGTISGYGSASFTFTVKAIDPCPTATITASIVTSGSIYYIYHSALSISISSFTSTVLNSICGLFTYTAYQSVDGGTTYNALDTTIFTLDDSTDPLLFGASSNSPSNCGTYAIKIVG